MHRPSNKMAMLMKMATKYPESARLSHRFNVLQSGSYCALTSSRSGMTHLYRKRTKEVQPLQRVVAYSKSVT